MNKKINVNNKNTLNIESHKIVEDNKKQVSTVLSQSKEKTTLEEIPKNDVSSPNKNKKEIQKNKTSPTENFGKSVVKEVDKKIYNSVNKEKENNEKLTEKNQNKHKKLNSATKEEMLIHEDYKSKVAPSKQNEKLSEKNIKKIQSRDQFDIVKAKAFCQDFDNYIENSGLTLAFKVIFSEILNKHIHQDNLFQYTAMRLRQIGKELEDLKTGNV